MSKDTKDVIKHWSITHCARSVTSTIECGMRVGPPTAIALRGGRHCKETHHEKRRKSHCEVCQRKIDAFRGEDEMR